MFFFNKKKETQTAVRRKTLREVGESLRILEGGGGGTPPQDPPQSCGPPGHITGRLGLRYVEVFFFGLRRGNAAAFYDPLPEPDQRGGGTVELSRPSAASTNTSTQIT